MAGKTGTWLLAWAAALGLCWAAVGLAADPGAHKRKPPAKQWHSLDNCRYVEHNGNDGDSFALQCATRKFILRLYFVDSPESSLQYGERVQEQAKHFGVTIDDSLAAGVRARDYARDALRGAFIVLTKRASASGRSKEPRYYGLVQVNGRLLHELLLLEGLAWVHGTSTALPDGTKARDHVTRLQALESQARAERRGVWARSLK
jgi:endonuclease YncB( thermonuclease family)